MWNSVRGGGGGGGCKKYRKLIVGEVEIVGRVGEKIFNSRGEDWLLNCFFISFSNHEKYSIKNICIYSKSKIKTKVTNKQNLEDFKVINWRLFSQKFFNNSRIVLSSERFCSRFHHGQTFLRWSTCAFRFY